MNTWPTQYFDVYAGWYQFYLYDERADFGTFGWTPEDLVRRVAVRPGIVAILTTRYDLVSVEFSVLTAPPGDASGPWDHLMAGGLKTTPRRRPRRLRRAAAVGGTQVAGQRSLSNQQLFGAPNLSESDSFQDGQHGQARRTSA